MRLLALPLLALSCAYGQSITFANTVQYSPSSLPTCGQEAFSVTQTATFSWTTWCPGNVAVQGGMISGTGTGFCPGGSTGGYCRWGTSNSPAPQFSPIIQGGGPWTVYVSVTSISGFGPNNSGCGTAAITQGSSSNVAVPQCTGHCQALGASPAPDNCSPSPIVIDAFGEGFHLTDAANGVNFRERSTDALIRMSWTDPAYHNAWLVRPNPDGSVTSLAANLFGNLSAQPKSDDPNGYRALAYWAEQEGCGVVDYLDAQNCAAIWTKLRLWQDANQDGVAQPGELHTLEGMGVERISLKFGESRWTDEYGNQFRYVAGIADADAPRDKRCYDVFLVTK